MVGNVYYLNYKKHFLNMSAVARFLGVDKSRVCKDGLNEKEMIRLRTRLAEGVYEIEERLGEYEQV